jgi:hypothetical protein
MSLSKRDYYSAVILVVLCLVVLIGIPASYFIPKWKSELKHRAEQAAAAEKLQAEREKNMAAYIEQRKSGEKERATTAARKAARQEMEKLDSFKPEISVLSDGVIISNARKETWDSVNVFVNSEPPFGYGCRLDNVKPLDSKAIPLSEFVDSDGKRFNPYTYKVLYIWIGNDQIKYHKYGF